MRQHCGGGRPGSESVGIDDPVAVALLGEETLPVGGEPLIHRFAGDQGAKWAGTLDGSPEIRDLVVGALEAYRAMPESEKEERFDPDDLGMLASYTETA